MSEQLSSLYSAALAQETKDVIRRQHREMEEYRKLWELCRAEWLREQTELKKQVCGLKERINRLETERDGYKEILDGLETFSEQKSGARFTDNCSAE